jgi:hypothetical protein
METLWYEKPRVLLDNIEQFIPNNQLKRYQKINALARLAIYLAILILVVNKDTKYLAIPIMILIISIFLGTSEKFTLVESDSLLKSVVLDNKKCQPPSIENPFMNYTIDDLITNPNRPPACDYDKSKTLMRQTFRSKLHSDTSDMWGQYITDRNFYTMPNTEIVNDQTGFAKWCYGNSGECKTTGKNCLKIQDPTYSRGRISLE